MRRRLASAGGARAALLRAWPPSPAGASASHNALEPVIAGAIGGNGASRRSTSGHRRRDARVCSRTEEPLAATDTDTAFDLYERTGGVTTQLSVGPNGGQRPRFGAAWKGASADGTRVFFQTNEPLVASDTDDCESPTSGSRTGVHRRVRVRERHDHAGLGRRATERSARRSAARLGGRHARLLPHEEQLSGADTDSRGRPLPAPRAARPPSSRPARPAATATSSPTTAAPRPTGRGCSSTPPSSSSRPTPTPRRDVYERAGGTTTLLSTGPAGGNGSADASSAGRRADGVARVHRDRGVARRVGHRHRDRRLRARRRHHHAAVHGPAAGTAPATRSVEGAVRGRHARLLPDRRSSWAASDTDSRLDVYERSGGTTTLLSTGPAGGNGPADALFQDVSGDGSTVVFGTAESLVAGRHGRAASTCTSARAAPTTLLSTGQRVGQRLLRRLLQRGLSSDGSRVIFETASSSSRRHGHVPGRVRARGQARRPGCRSGAAVATARGPPCSRGPRTTGIACGSRRRRSSRARTRTSAPTSSRCSRPRRIRAPRARRRSRSRSWSRTTNAPRRTACTDRPRSAAAAPTPRATRRSRPPTT